MMRFGKDNLTFVFDDCRCSRLQIRLGSYLIIRIIR